MSVNGIRQASTESSEYFSVPVVYSVMAEDQISTADWTVTVNKETSYGLDD